MLAGKSLRIPGDAPEALVARTLLDGKHQNAAHGQLVEMGLGHFPGRSRDHDAVEGGEIRHAEGAIAHLLGDIARPRRRNRSPAVSASVA